MGALDRWRRPRAPEQLELALARRPPIPEDGAPRPDEAARLLARLRALGLRGIGRCALTRNRSTMASFRGDALRLHRAFATAPEDVLRAVIGFVNGRGTARRAARRALAAFAIPRDPERERARRPAASHPDDAALAARLGAAHTALNGERFAGVLGPVAIRVSRRMRSRLGHYAPGLRSAPEIAIARRHVRRDAWPSVLETLMHEMVHQWQHETGRPVAHDADFRRKCREVGIAPRARRRT
ncbi:MAG: SprT-like domain-containing protein [Deltaproteobacteria bacterium]|nr:SprT-like domain-containing protein [Deltaproteobacteria bacterium]